MNKKILLFSALVMFPFFQSFAQKEEWTAHFDRTKEAGTLDDDFYATKDSTKIAVVVAKYNEALALIAQVESKSSDYKDAAAFRKASINVWISFLYEKVNNIKKQKEYVDKAYSFWPALYTLNAENVKKHVKFTNSYPLEEMYTKMAYLAINAAYENYDYEEAFEVEKKFNPAQNGADAYYGWAALYDLARAYEGYYEDGGLYDLFSDEGDVSGDDVLKHWVMALEAWPKVPGDDKERNKGPLDFIISGIAIYTTSDNALKLRTAKALYVVEKYADADTWFSSYASSATMSLDDAWQYSESAMKEPDKSDARIAVQAIEKYSSGFSEYELERLQKVYEFIGDFAKAQEIKIRIEQARKRAEEERRLQAQREEEERREREREDRKANARGNFSLAVATNPLMYIWNDYPVSLDIRIGRVASEFRVNFANTRPGKGDPYHFTQWKAEGFTKDKRYHYSGYEFSYTLKFLSKEDFNSTRSKRKEFVGGYFGLQPRYSIYNFNTEVIQFLNTTNNISETHTITANAKRYEFCLMGGFLGDNLGGFFHVDYYFGVGIGYRSLDITSKEDAAFSTANYTFDGSTDRRYEPDRWNKIYVPVRLGVRFGFNLL